MNFTTWQDVPVLVTGAGGFIGSHLVEALVSQGARVRAFVRYNARGDPGLLGLVPAETFGQVEVVPGDLRDLDGVAAAVKGMQVVFHLGAVIAIPYSYVHPAEVVATNVTGTLNVLLACRESGVRRLVHTSTSEVYGTALTVPIAESHPLQGQSPYSASKIGADKLVESFYRSFDLPVTTLRPFNTFGPRQSARAVIPTIITQALAQDTVHLGNLAASRDLGYISDTVRAFLLAGITPGIEGETIHLGTGREVTITQLAGMILGKVRERTGRAAEIAVDLQRLRPPRSEVARLLADSARARQKLGWQPEVSLEEGLDRTIDWIAARLDLYRPALYQR